MEYVNSGTADTSPDILGSPSAGGTYILVNALTRTCLDLSGGDNRSCTSPLSPFSSLKRTSLIPIREQVIGWGVHVGFNQLVRIVRVTLSLYLTALPNGRNQWAFQAASEGNFYIKLANSTQYISIAGEPSKGQRVVASVSPFAWSIREEPGSDSGIRYVNMPRADPGFISPTDSSFLEHPGQLIFPVEMGNGEHPSSFGITTGERTSSGKCVSCWVRTNLRTTFHICRVTSEMVGTR